MRNVPFEAAKKICDDYDKDQCIILSWDKTSGNTWVTTFGVGDENSIQATNAGKVLKDYLKLQRENDCIPKQFEEWSIESVDRYYYASGRNYWTYREVTHWYEKHTMERKEKIREETISTGNEWNLSEWAKGITCRMKSLESDF